ncbi:hypothetical protein CYLTODRAFT_419022 [Cylindrobasidium torrendii FP15055 ss-10]|uniref:Homeodomain-like protein n=1 Tax=Cylindrobasidium torrendii FP15055 ss-10 TaxID=1314674 RepID=A0A0D7BNJ8_9AGAR|nr:hypothetical protein CYLTODRAFT_419022 [Cylindrobasidium torrendii FP15055 ss-10]
MSDPLSAMSMQGSRERRAWTIAEDEALRQAVELEDGDNPAPSKWFAISKHVPGRTNKDCRKRWFAKMASDVTKGGWAPDEDDRLRSAIDQYGPRWSMIASCVGTRNSDQCAKRWTDTLNPAIDRTSWTPEADAALIKAVEDHGKVWTKIVKQYFPGRTGLSAKNRYNSITRVNGEASRSIRGVSSPRASHHVKVERLEPPPAPPTSSYRVQPQMQPVPPLLSYAPPEHGRTMEAYPGSAMYTLRHIPALSVPHQVQSHSP